MKKDLATPICRSVHARIIIWWSILLVTYVVLVPQKSPIVEYYPKQILSDKNVRFEPAVFVEDKDVFFLEKKSSSLEKRLSTESVVVSVDLNHASVEQLCQIKGIGPVLALRIVEYRKTHGTFSSVDDLDSVKGIGSKTVEKLKLQNLWVGKNEKTR